MFSDYILLANWFDSQKHMEEIADRLDQCLLHCPELPLVEASLVMPGVSGLYNVYRFGRLMYHGESDNVRSRVGGQHFRKISRASGVDINDITVRWVPCGAVRLSVENMLIERYKPEWNGLGFGNNAPGQGRKNQRPSKWDIKYGFRHDQSSGQEAETAAWDSPWIDLGRL